MIFLFDYEEMKYLKKIDFNNYRDANTFNLKLKLEKNNIYI